MFLSPCFCFCYVPAPCSPCVCFVYIPHHHPTLRVTRSYTASVPRRPWGPPLSGPFSHRPPFLILPPHAAVATITLALLTMRKYPHKDWSCISQLISVLLVSYPFPIRFSFRIIIYILSEARPLRSVVFSFAFLVVKFILPSILMRCMLCILSF